MRSSACRWRTNCCGIFCDPLEGGEARSKIPHYIPPQGGIPNIRDVCVFCSIQKRILRLCPSPRQTEEGCCSCGAHCTAAGTQLPYLWLKIQNIYRNPKTVLRIMKHYDLLSEIRRHRKWKQMGQQLHKYENLLNREFHADRPNRKWVTDISYIHTKQGVLYLSMIRDLYDNSIVAYKTSSQQTVNLVLDTIRLAMRKEKKKVAAELQLHSDQGFQYTSQAYFKLTQSYGITPSMSRKGNPYVNAMAENFFSILKTECIYRHKPRSFQEANEMIDSYIHFYNHERIQTKTGVAPLTQRHFT